MSFKHAILGLLSGGPLHGYELKGAYESELVPTAQVNFGQVYTTLERLLRDDLVACQQVNQAERPDKKVYSLTRKGRVMLDQWLTKPARHHVDGRNETFLKLNLAQRVPGHDAARCLERERDACFRHLQELTQARLQAEKDDASLQTVLMLDLATLQLEAFIKWLERCEEVFQTDE